MLNKQDDVNDSDKKDTTGLSSPLPFNAEAKDFVRKLKQQYQQHRSQQNQNELHRQQQQKLKLQSRHRQLDLDSLKECDPDVGILSCGEKEYCMNKTGLGMDGQSGGLCVPMKDDEGLVLELQNQVR